VSITSRAVERAPSQPAMWLAVQVSSPPLGPRKRAITRVPRSTNTPPPKPRIVPSLRHAVSTSQPAWRAWFSVSDVRADTQRTREAGMPRGERDQEVLGIEFRPVPRVVPFAREGAPAP
jgi:hypothetical protein